MERADPRRERDAPHPPLMPLERPRSPEHLIGLDRLSLRRSPVTRLDVRDRRGTDQHPRGEFLLCPPALIPHRDHFRREHAPLVIFTAPTGHFTPPPVPPLILTPAAALSNLPRLPQKHL